MNATGQPSDPSAQRRADTTPETPGRLVHLRAALIAVPLFLSALYLVSWLAERAVDRHIYALASDRYTQKELGLVVQQRALRRSDILPLYGSSEIDRLSALHARELFADGPTGFSVLAVAGAGTPILETLQSIGALAREYRGRKVVLSLSPPMFLLPTGDMLLRRHLGNFSPIQALRTVMSPELSVGFKRMVAQRLVQYPEALNRNTVLDAITHVVSSDRPAMRLLYYVLWPVGWIQQRLLSEQDKILVLGHVLQTALPEAARRVPKTDGRLDYTALLGKATDLQKSRSTSNSWDVNDIWWGLHADWVPDQENTTSDAEFLQQLAVSETWTDLDQYLQLVKELDLDALLISMPFDGRFMDYTGVSASARSHYYARVREVGARYGVRTLLFDDKERHPFFFDDLWSHFGPVGWVYFDQALDAFYHDDLR
jgi:D-alanine transfer protein